MGGDNVEILDITVNASAYLVGVIDEALAILPSIGSQLKSMGAESLNIDDFAQAIKDVLNDSELKISMADSQKIVQKFFQEQEGDSEKIDNWVLDHVVPVIEQTPWLNGHKIFIKNGCYSHKFNFTNGCLITDQSDEEQLIKNICNIQYEAICYDKCGYLELILREYIEPEKTDTPTIYHGMPLRPEIRIFYNFDIHQLLYAINYWDWDYCHDAICYSFLGEDKLPDADIYETAYPTLDAETKRLFEKHRPQIEKALATVTTLQMPGEAPNIWSVDFLMEENRVWLIDMAQGWRSAYWDRQKAGV